MKTKVYDLPTRLFHALFAGLFLAAFFIAKVIDEESRAYALHMLFGLVMVWIVGFRIIWGFIGSRYARFSSFALSRKALLEYLGHLLTGTRSQSPGHNPASSWATLIMMALAIGLGITGYLMTTGGNREVIKEVHELFANSFLVVTIAHVAGVTLHTLRHRDRLPFAMIHGGKEGIDAQAGIRGPYRGAAILFLVLTAAFVSHLGKNYDLGSQKLSLFGSTLQLGELPDGNPNHEGNDDD